MAHDYLVQKWLDGKAGTWQRISANSELEAAELEPALSSGSSASSASFARVFASSAI